VKRDIAALTNREYDLVVLGGGIFGVCIAWDAALRGLSVALVEKGDFAQATSTNHFRMIHGGMRYMQHGDLVRVRESSYERSAFLRIAPHLAHPIPFVIPTYGHGMKGKEILGVGLRLYDFLTTDRNKGIQDKTRHIPNTRSISREECLELFPHLHQQGLTGAVIFYDGQVYNPSRFALAFVKSADRIGAQVANYVEVTDLIRTENRITGIRACDRESGSEFELHGKVIVNATGPWAAELLKNTLKLQIKPLPSFSRDAFFIIRRRLSNQYALGLSAHTKDADAILSRGSRHLFIIPWQEYTLLGVWHEIHSGSPDQFQVTVEELQGFIDEINNSYPFAQISRNEVSRCISGLILFGEETRQGKKDISFGKRSLIIDHASTHHLEGLVTVIGVRFTTARGIAEKVVDLAFRKLGKVPPKSKTAFTPIYGGQIEDFDGLLQTAIRDRPAGVCAETVPQLVHNHGSVYPEVFQKIQQDPDLGATIGESKVIRAEVVHAILEEMALTLEDVVLRRTNLGAGAHPGIKTLNQVADLMASELSWSTSRVQIEIENVNTHFPNTGEERS
jgi:glycerol-3-phosphate dehydrogenase